jgi:hypothetical protein
MIAVIRIAGESLDLQTGAEMPKALVLSNGISEYTLFVDDDTARAVIGMQRELEEGSEDKASVGPEPTAVEKVKPLSKAPAQVATMAVVDDEEERPQEEDELEPGEEYQDSQTGVDSL